MCVFMYVCVYVYVRMHMYVYVCMCVSSIDRENFLVKKVRWDKSLTHFNFVDT